MSKIKEILVCCAIFFIPAIVAFPLREKAKSYKKVISPYQRTIDQLKGIEILWVDARKEKKFRMRNIPGSINISQYNWEKGMEDLFMAFEKFDPEGTIVVYCNVGCHDSEAVATRLRDELGNDKVYFLKGGINAWFDAQQ